MRPVSDQVVCILPAGFLCTDWILNFLELVLFLARIIFGLSNNLCPLPKKWNLFYLDRSSSTQCETGGGGAGGCEETYVLFVGKEVILCHQVDQQNQPGWWREKQLSQTVCPHIWLCFWYLLLSLAVGWVFFQIFFASSWAEWVHSTIWRPYCLVYFLSFVKLTC